MPTILHLLSKAVRDHRDRVIYTYFSSKGRLTERLTVGELYERASKVAILLRASAQRGACVLVVCNPALDTIVNFFGTLMAGMIAVPVPPQPRLKRTSRLQAIAENSGALIILGLGEEQAKTLQTIMSGTIRSLNITHTNQITIAGARLQSVIPTDIALLQYTSGSTGAPKGVKITHNNLLANAVNIHHQFDLNQDDRCVLWLPLHHDMGLMAGVIQPLYSGFHTSFLSPAAFISNPLSWLKLISQRRATLSGAPNFAFDLCVQHSTLKPHARLQLRSWRVAFCGSEIVRRRTLEAFADAFSAHGFNRSAFHPCYGLAEATLLVAASQYSRKSILHVAADKMQQGIVEVCSSEGASRELVAVGGPEVNSNVLIADPNTCKVIEDDRIGEIWVAGEQVTEGYWKRTCSGLFHDRQDQEGNKGPTHYLRTGDLGFLHKGLLYIAGRLKDVLIINGQNYYPEDIEEVVSGVATLQKNRNARSAAFSVTDDSYERLIIVHETDRHLPELDRVQTTRDVRRAISTSFGIIPDAILLVAKGMLPRTTSGKIRRQECKRRYLEHSLDYLYCDPSSQSAYRTSVRQKGQGVGNSSAANETAKEMCERIRQFAGYPLDPTVAIGRLGLDSLTLMQIRSVIQRAHKREMSFEQLSTDVTVGLAIELLSPLLTNDEHGSGSLAGTVEDQSRRRAYPLSAGQNAMWFLQRLKPEDTSLSVVRLLKIRGDLRIELLETAFSTLLEMHPVLRIRIRPGKAGPRQAMSQVCPKLEVCDASQLTYEEITRAAEEVVKQPYELESGDVMRGRLYRVSQRESYLLLCVHHIVIDLSSLVTLVRDLTRCYQSLTEGIAATQRAEPVRSHTAIEYGQFALWQQAMLASEQGKRLSKFWLDRLAYQPKELELNLAERGRFSGLAGTHRFRLPSLLLGKVVQMAKENGATVHAVLLTVLQVLLYRYSDQREFLISVLSNSRTQPQWRDMVGYFVNPLVLRVTVPRNCSFAEFLRLSKSELLEAIEQNDYPFPKLVEELKPNRRVGKSPITRILCMLQPVLTFGDCDLGGLAMGTEGTKISCAGITLESLKCSLQDFRGLEYDLVFEVGQVGDELEAALHYDKGYFKTWVIEEMSKAFSVLLADVTSRPNATLESLALVSAEDFGRLVLNGGTNVSRQESRSYQFVHEAIEGQAAVRPNQPAITSDADTMTYQELVVAVDKLARYLTKRGARPEAAIAILMERSTEMVVAILAVLKSGAAYVPIDWATPKERLHKICRSADVAALVTTSSVSQDLLGELTGKAIYLDRAITELDGIPLRAEVSNLKPDNLAYIIFTSGSTGDPKGVMISHRGLSTFCDAMNAKVSFQASDVLLAVTTIAFDISILEIIYTLTRGCHIVLSGEVQSGVSSAKERMRLARRPISFSIFYFASEDTQNSKCNDYNLLLEGAKLADRLGLEAVWMPERHFHPFGGLYPNPSVTAAAVGAVTRQIQVRAGSVVLPLHDVVRVVEEWSIVDRLTGGRTGVAFASGWHANDFVFAPGQYAERRELTLQRLETVRRLWRGEKVEMVNGKGIAIQIGTFPRPLQSDLPIWLTSGGTTATFVSAADVKANVLTHLLGQDIEGLTGKIADYRHRLGSAASPVFHGRVTLMVHTYIDSTVEAAIEKAIDPLKRYLASSAELMASLLAGDRRSIDFATIRDDEREVLVDYAARRHLETSGLFGNESICLEQIDEYASAGVDEVACLIDFGIDAASVVKSIERIGNLKQRLETSSVPHCRPSIGALATRHKITLLQCTPSLLRVIMNDPLMMQAMGEMRAVLLGGETVPVALMHAVYETGAAEVWNMYGPTETTIWSAAQKLDRKADIIDIAGAVEGTRLYLLDTDLALRPPGLVGEIYIGGEGLARGYLNDPVRTADNFLPDPYCGDGQMRIYRTGDLAWQDSDGRLRLIGRYDQQVKVLGNRVDLGEVESAIANSPYVSDCAVVCQQLEDNIPVLVAYLVPRSEIVDDKIVREHLRNKLPLYMIPNRIEWVARLPLNANGKVDRKRLGLGSSSPTIGAPESHAGLTETETVVSSIWRSVLQIGNIRPTDNFFDIGGHSLLMLRVQKSLQKTFSRDIPLLVLLENPTVKAIADYLDDTSVSIDAEPAETRVSRQKRAIGAHQKRLGHRVRDMAVV